MTINGIELTPEQEAQLVEMYAQWREEAKQIPDPEPNKAMLDNGKSGAFYELTCKYKSRLREILFSKEGF